MKIRNQKQKQKKSTNEPRVDEVGASDTLTSYGHVGTDPTRLDTRPLPGHGSGHVTRTVHGRTVPGDVDARVDLPRADETTIRCSKRGRREVVRTGHKVG